MGWLSHPSESRTLEYKTGQTIWEKKNKSWDLRTRAKEAGINRRLGILWQEVRLFKYFFPLHIRNLKPGKPMKEA